MSTYYRRLHYMLHPVCLSVSLSVCPSVCLCVHLSAPVFHITYERKVVQNLLLAKTFSVFDCIVTYRTNLRAEGHEARAQNTQ